MKPSLWRSWFAPKLLKSLETERLLECFSSGDLWGAMFWLNGGVGVVIGGLGFSWIWALLVVCIVGLLAYVGGYNRLMTYHKYSKYSYMAVRFPLATLLGGSMGWGTGFILFSAINSNSAYQVFIGSQVLALLLSFLVGLVPSFVGMLKLVRHQLKFYDTRNEDDDTGIIGGSYAVAIFLIMMPAVFLLILLNELLKRLPASPFTAWFMGTDPQVILVFFVGLGCLPLLLSAWEVPSPSLSGSSPGLVRIVYDVLARLTFLRWLPLKDEVYGDVFFADREESVLFFRVTLGIFTSMGQKND